MVGLLARTGVRINHQGITIHCSKSSSLLSLSTLCFFAIDAIASAAAALGVLEAAEVTLLADDRARCNSKNKTHVRGHILKAFMSLTNKFGVLVKHTVALRMFLRGMYRRDLGGSKQSTRPFPFFFAANKC
jgi:hypothetical protein